MGVEIKMKTNLTPRIRVEETTTAKKPAKAYLTEFLFQNLWEEEILISVYPVSHVHE